METRREEGGFQHHRQRQKHDASHFNMDFLSCRTITVNFTSNCLWNYWNSRHLQAKHAVNNADWMHESLTVVGFAQCSSVCSLCPSKTLKLKNKWILHHFFLNLIIKGSEQKWADITESNSDMQQNSQVPSTSNPADGTSNLSENQENIVADDEVGTK